MKIITITFLLFAIAGCSNQFTYTSTYFDYSGKDGCTPANIGHWLGGDLPGYASNTLEGMRAIESKQSSNCFKNWEFDVNQTADDIILWHDSTYNNVPLINTGTEKFEAPTLKEFVLAFESLNVTKPVVIDLKTEIAELDWHKLLEAARSIRNQHEVPVWFLISPNLASNSLEVCGMVDQEFDILLYRRGGRVCK